MLVVASEAWKGEPMDIVAQRYFAELLTEAKTKPHGCVLWTLDCASPAMLNSNRKLIR